MLSFAYNFTLSHRGFVHLSFRSLSFSEPPCEFICTTQYFSFPLVKWVWKQHFVRFLWRLGRLWYAEGLEHLINFSVAFSFYSSPYCHRSHLFRFVFGSLGLLRHKWKNRLSLRCLLPLIVNRTLAQALREDC